MKYKSIFALVLTVTAGLQAKNTNQKINDFFSLCFSGSTFFPTLGLSALIYGKECTFNVIAGDDIEAVQIYDTPHKIGVLLGENERVGTTTHYEILEIHDGCKTPLILGSIPYKEKHLRNIRKSMGLNKNSKIHIISLNRKFERDWSGLSKLIQDTPNTLELTAYPTTDFTAPALVDIIKAVHTIKERDNRDEEVTYVHCKAGKGRSATIVAAYLIARCYDACIETTPEQIEAYLKKRRPQVYLNRKQKAALYEFQNTLKQFGNFNLLYKKVVHNLKV